MEVLTDIGGHFMAGLALSTIDRAKYRSTSERDRMEYTGNCIDSIERILAANKSIEEKGEVKYYSGAAPESLQEYHSDMKTVAEYLVTHKTLDKKRIVDNRSRLEKISQGIDNFKLRHFLYDNTVGQNWWFSAKMWLGITAADWVYGISSANREDMPMVEIGHFVWEAPAVWAGVMTGKGAQYLVRKTKRWGKSEAEREQEDLIEQAVDSTNIVDLVMQYQPSEGVLERVEYSNFWQKTKSVLSGTYMKLELMTDNISNKANSVIEEVSQRLEREPQMTEEERRQKSIERFNELTRDK